MKLTDILKELEQVQSEAFEEKADRRHILRNLGFKVAKIASPFAIAGLTVNKVAAKTTDILAEAIVFMLNMSYMQADFYKQALAVGGLIPDSQKGGFQKILKDKNAHIAYWISHLNKTGNVVPTVPAYDFTGKGTLPKTLSDYKAFLTLAHAIEDAGVRMYLTGIDMLISNKAFRSDAMNMATVNARHAAHVRLLRRNTGVDMMPWVSGTEAYSLVGEIKKAYQNEDNTNQLKVSTVGINGFDISFNAATEAFDEKMGLADAEIFMRPFIV
ncbi:hypothetical protein CAP35_05565 [Chitinophagaceae bacterium IBVUCB1]|nr:hypothetical protein CAP35_05565 [Chitinophagaceae bacterium IBVUCB1]